MGNSPIVWCHNQSGTLCVACDGICGVGWYLFMG